MPRVSTIPLFLGFVVLTNALFAQTPVGSDTATSLYSPFLAGSGAFISAEGGAPVSAINPASGGAAQRIVADAGYLALPGLGSESGLGHAVELGLLYPTKYAVFGGNLRLLSSPFDSFPIGTTFAGNFNVAKELYPGMTVGTGLNVGFGTDWTASLDLGFRYAMGDWKGLKNFTWAVTLDGFGKSWIPSPFTPTVGAAFDAFTIAGKDGKPDPLKIRLSADAGFPSFTNLTGQVGLSATVAQLVTVSTSTLFNVKEALNNQGPMVLPSVGITLNFTLSGGHEKIAGKLPSDGEVAGTLGGRPLYNGVWAMGTGISWSLGVLDKNPPRIRVDYPETRWISPNNDGKADVLEFPISITDERYVMGWTFEIRDSNGQVVRTYHNKERRPETQGFQNVLDRLTDVKSGVEIPKTLRWDGIGDNGAVVADGHYFFTLQAVDDNGNSGTSSRYEVVVDNTPPAITIEKPQASDLIFSPDGDGNKDTLTIVQSGSVEDRWDAGIYDGTGHKIRNFDITNGAPQTLVWDGKNDQGVIVADGVYSYRIAATDRALNSNQGSLENIIVDTQKPTVSLLIGDGYFSPNGDAVKDTMLFSPGVPIKDGIVSWTLSVLDKTGKTRRTYSGNTAPPSLLAFDGKDDQGKLLEEGTYQGQLGVTYLNGWVAKNLSPTFVLDITAPTATVRNEYPAFSPNNDGNLDQMAIQQDGSREVEWQGEVRRAANPSGTGVLIKTFTFAGVPDPRVLWDGRDDAGRLAPDGDYEYRLVSTDRAGNTGYSNTVRFTLTTTDTPVLLSADRRSFSPNGDGVFDTLTLTPQLQVSSGVSSWKIDILNSSGVVVKSFSGAAPVPPALVWNGQDNSGNTVPDGDYTAHAQIRYVAGNQPEATSQAFTVDTVAPQATVSAPYLLFSPNADGKKDYLPLQVTTDGNDDWQGTIENAQGKTVMTWKWTGSAPSLLWNGTDEAGNPVSDGVYRFTLHATDGAGNSTTKTLDGITVDSRIPRAFLTASATGISPNGDGIDDTVQFSILLSLKEGIEQWKLELIDKSGVSRRTFGSPTPVTDTATVAPPPDNLVWDGKDDTGKVIEGKFTPRLTVSYRKGDLVSVTTADILVDITGPVLTFTAAPRYFSPDNDGVDDELTINLTAQDASPISAWSLDIREPQAPYQLFYHIEGKGTIAEKILWDGRSNKGELVQAATDYPATFQATDALGNSSKVDGIVGVDVLVLREGDTLKIKVPSIIFRENAPDFIGLSQDTVDNNIRVLKRIAQILNKFRDYKVKVEGHANPVTRTADEEKKELQPLSEARAKAVLEKLVEYGVDRGRLSYIGMGGTQPVVPWENRADWWKNRRVEFILIK